MSSPDSTVDSSTDVAIVGAGPYGLSIASHLTQRGVVHRIFGQPMHTWRHMFPGMGLKSPDFGTNICTPERGYSFIEYCESHSKDYREPIAISLFAEYGQWAQERLVPEVEPCHVTRVGPAENGFRLELDTGERLHAHRVVMATGLAHWRRMPGVFAGLPSDLVTHTSDRSDLTPLRGKDVTVIGAGQSALEAATLLYEQRSAGRLLVRGDGAYFAPPPSSGRRSLMDRLRNPRSVLGPGRLNYVLWKVPMGPHVLLPEARRVRLTRTHLGPWGAWWLRDRFEGNVTVHSGCSVIAAEPVGSGLRLRVRRTEGSDWELETDHVICGTGYEVDLDRHPVLDPALTALIDRVERAPRLSGNFESSVSGLYFVGAASAFSFGPLTRFVAGAEYTAPRLARRLARTARPVAMVGRPAPARIPAAVE